MAIRRVRLVITIDNLDYTIRDVAFEGFVLNYYENLWEWRKANNNASDFLTL
jgi:hypothetical protein